MVILQPAALSVREVGTFLSADGRDQRDRVQLAGTKSAPVGSALAAVDSGGEEVYRPGAPGWWHNLVGAAAAGLVGAAWAWTFPVRVLRRRRARARPEHRPDLGVRPSPR